MKHREEHARLAFDEQRAITDLQNLEREIQRVRGERERAEAEFDEFLRGFRTKPASPPRSQPPPEPVAVPPELPGAIETVRPSPDPADTQHQPDTTDASLVAKTDTQERKPVVVAPRRHHARAAVIVAIAAVAVITGLFAIRARRFTPVAPVSNPSTLVEPNPENVGPNAATPSAPTPVTPPSPSAEGSEPQAGVNLEIVTRRSVWVRVTVDGRRAIERELPAGQRIPLQADRTIVIRAGDAGAVAVRLQGSDEVVLGRDGVVATREFSREGSRTPTPVR